LIVWPLLPSAAAAAVSFVRLTPDQYERVIHDVFGTSIQVDANFVETSLRDDGLIAVGNRKLTITAAGFEQYEATAQQVAAQALDPKRAATLVPCQLRNDALTDDSCIERFVSRVGLLLFRRPLSEREQQSYVSMARLGTAKLGSFRAALQLTLANMLVAPEFLFREERDEADPTHPDQRRLDAFSAASRLSFFLWNTTPDRQLLSAAQSGELQTRRGLEREVNRLLSSARLEGGVRAFFSDFLGFDAYAILAKDTTIFPQFTRHVAEDSREQTLRTVVDHLLIRDREYRDLFITRDTFLTPSLAALYGVPLPNTPELGRQTTTWVPYEYPNGDQHSGILTQISFLSLNSHPGRTSPTLRGKALREKLLCQKVPPPPGNVNFNLVQDTSNPKYKTARQRLTAHRTEPMCAGCHKLTDPLGFAFEDFDSAGAYRTTENGAPIDASGEFEGKKFDDAAQLSDLVRNSPEAASCFITRVYSYGVSRPTTAQERSWFAQLQSGLTRSGIKWRELMRDITTSPLFYEVPQENSQAGANPNSDPPPSPK
jgi:hypothetical protein